MGPHWGIDIASDYIEGAVVADAASAKTLRRMRIPTEQAGGYYHVLGQVHKLVEVLSADVGVRPDVIGVAHAGALDPVTKTLKATGVEHFDGKPLLSDLETYLGVPIRLASAAHCLALAEVRLGVVPEVMPAARCIVGLRVDAEVGAGIVVNGRVLRGRQGIAGAWGHNFLDESGGRCACGRRGCTETLLSTRALEAFYADASGGRRATLREIAELAAAHDDEAAARTIERLAYNFARAVGPVINLLDPDCIVVGGEASRVEALFTQGPDLIKRFVHNTRLDTLLLRPKLGRRATALGAALL